MLLVDPTTGPEPFIPQTNGRLETDPYSYPHGLTPPLKHVRQRRFRKKLSKRVSKQKTKLNFLQINSCGFIYRQLKKWNER
jgi:transcription initiation factor TFIID subunit 7